VTLFRLTLQPGRPIVDQVVFAATKALLSGELKAGEGFPSVRNLAADLKIHPNTAHKVVQHLIREGWLENHPGVGTIVAAKPQARPGAKQKLLKDEVEHLVVEAKRVGLDLEGLQAAIDARWRAMDSNGDGS
jgi:GntR family transcriptional regulator